ncbi:MAG: gamma-glutamyl-gamma-aminobutyrate hydrolase family protein [Alphaproteobacteria bacterium]|nr:gamma-glutamyl-gamma-aminobutyrate hydrolase family protein [Alphaproteobacteria bacterium]
MRNPPLIGVTADLQQGPVHRQHIARIQYVNAVLDGIGGMPVVIPAIGARQDIDALLDRLDGLLFTGSPSNVDPSTYGVDGEGRAPADPDRDATTLPLLRAALAKGVPILAICRGHQELNVAAGGTLHQYVELLPDHIDHRAPEHDDPNVRYANRHWVEVVPGSLLTRIADSTSRLFVNSLHGQGIDKLGDGLAVEATHEDGTIEAVRWTKGPGFAFGVQWHPEWHIKTDKFAAAIFRHFASVVAEYRQRRTA